MVGATLGAGVGRYQGLHGLIIDALLSVRIVVASGELVTASSTENSDLFWAIRGAGANFGIITYATYKIADLTNRGQVLNADFRFPVSKNESVWSILKTLNDNTLPAPASILLIMVYDPNYGGVCALVSPFAPSKHLFVSYTPTCPPLKFTLIAKTGKHNSKRRLRRPRTNRPSALQTLLRSRPARAKRVRGALEQVRQNHALRPRRRVLPRRRQPQPLRLGHQDL